jgi:hypothetical protein
VVAPLVAVDAKDHVPPLVQPHPLALDVLLLAVHLAVTAEVTAVTDAKGVLEHAMDALDVLLALDVLDVEGNAPHHVQDALVHVQEDVRLVADALGLVRANAIMHVQLQMLLP